MSRRHCHSARRESRPSNCALSNNERHPTARTLPLLTYIPLFPHLPRSRVIADVRRLELFASKVHVKPLPQVEHLDGVREHYALRVLRKPNNLCKLPPIASCLEQTIRANDVRSVHVGAENHVTNDGSCYDAVGIRFHVHVINSQVEGWRQVRVLVQGI